jgi:hypothetical protein
MNVFIILSLLVIVIGIILLVVSPSVLFKLNWKEKTKLTIHKKHNPKAHIRATIKLKY